MAAVNNEGFSSLGTPTGSLTDITDGSDAVHTGIVKALNRMATGNVALSGFDISAVTSNSITFGNGNVLKDGELTAITGATVTIGVSDRVDGAYHLIIVSGTTLGYRVGAANIVADYNDGDVIIGVGKYVNSSTNMQFQYLTGQKTKNAVSIAYDNSGTYTEAGKISGDANGILITGTSDVSLDGTNDRVYIKDATDNTLKTVTPQSIADLASGYTDGEAVAAIETESGLDFSTASSDAIIQNTVLDKDIIFRVNDGGSNVDRLILYGDNDPSYPNTEAKLEGSLLATEEIRCNGIYLGYGNTPLTGTADIICYSSSEPLVFKTGTGSIERMRIDTAGKVGIGKTPSIELDVNGDIGGNRFLPESVQYTTTIESGNGSAIPPVNFVNMDDTVSIYRVSTTASIPPNPPNNLDCILPTSTSNEGLTFKLICTDNAGGPDDCTLSSQGADIIIDAGGANLGSPFSLATGKAYDLICFSGEWMLIQLN